MDTEIDLDFIPNYAQDLQISIKSWLENESVCERERDLDNYFNLLINDPSFKTMAILPMADTIVEHAEEPRTIQPNLHKFMDGEISYGLQTFHHFDICESVKDAANCIQRLQTGYITAHNALIGKMNNSIERARHVYRRTCCISSYADSNKSYVQGEFLIKKRFKAKIQSLKASFLEKVKEILKDILVTYSSNCERNRRFSKHIISVLEDSFKDDPYPNESEKERIAIQCQLSMRQVNNWFTNKRNRTKIHE